MGALEFEHARAGYSPQVVGRPCSESLNFTKLLLTGEGWTLWIAGGHVGRDAAVNLIDQYEEEGRERRVDGSCLEWEVDNLEHGPRAVAAYRLLQGF